jgi:hypothetical protein
MHHLDALSMQPATQHSPMLTCFLSADQTGGRPPLPTHHGINTSESLDRQLSELLANAYSESTRAAHQTAWAAWLTFWVTSGASLRDVPTTTDVARFTAQLVYYGNVRAVKYTTVARYVGSVCQQIERTFQVNHREQLIVTTALLGARRVLGDTRQHARPIKLAELRLVMVQQQGETHLRWLERSFVSACAFWGALQLGAFYEHRLTWEDLVLSERGLTVTLRSSKTNQYAARRHIFLIPYIHDRSVCAVAAYILCRDAGMVVGGALVAASWSAPALIASVSAVLLACVATTWEKGHITRHSFRRGFVQFAVSLGPHRGHHAARRPEACAVHAAVHW